MDTTNITTGETTEAAETLATQAPAWPPAGWVEKTEVARLNGRSRSLGRFRDEIAAAEAYDEAARELFGEHAWLNFPAGVDAFLEAEAAHAAGDHKATPRAAA